jgi:hypothetical protein
VTDTTTTCLNFSFSFFWKEKQNWDGLVSAIGKKQNKMKLLTFRSSEYDQDKQTGCRARDNCTDDLIFGPQKSTYIFNSFVVTSSFFAFSSTGLLLIQFLYLGFLFGLSLTRLIDTHNGIIRYTSMYM